MTKAPGQSAAFAASVFERYQSGLLRFLVRRLCAAQDSADIAQEVYLRLLRLEGTELVRQPQAYVYAIASHVVAQFRMRAQLAPVTFDSETIQNLSAEASDDSTEKLDERLDAQRRVTRLLDALPEMHRAVLVLRKRDGLSHVEIARELGLSTHTVKKYLHEAVVRIRAMRWEE
jgi:RNA polymerase sigma-70 factor (ECF subfamily)